MYVSSIMMIMDDKLRDFPYRSEFDYHVFFIGYYLKKTLLKKIKYPTDGSFQFITIIVGENDFNNDPQSDTRDGRTDVFKILYVNIKFDFEYYDKGDERSRCEYFIDLYKCGLQKAMTMKDLPYDAMVNALEVLRSNGFRYRWNLRTMLVRDFNLRVKFDCELNYNEFKMEMEAYSTNPKSSDPLCSGVVIKTKPDETHFDHVISKKNTIQRNHDILFICTSWGDRLFYLDLKDILKHCFKIYLYDPVYLYNPADKGDLETYRYLQNALLPSNFDNKRY